MLFSIIVLTHFFKNKIFKPTRKEKEEELLGVGVEVGRGVTREKKDFVEES